LDQYNRTSTCNKHRKNAGQKKLWQKLKNQNSTKTTYSQTAVLAQKKSKIYPNGTDHRHTSHKKSFEVIFWHIYHQKSPGHISNIQIQCKQHTNKASKCKINAKNSQMHKVQQAASREVRRKIKNSKQQN